MFLFLIKVGLLNKLQRKEKYNNELIMVDWHFYEGNGDIIYKGDFCYKKDGDEVIVPHEFDTDDFIEKSKMRFIVDEDRIGHLMTKNYETLSEQEWRKFWSDVRMAQIYPRAFCLVPYRSKHVNIFEKYSIDELKGIYENKYIWTVTEYFVYYLKKHDDHIIIEYKNKRKALSDLLYIANSANYIIQELYFKSDKELSELMMKHHACEYLHELLSEDDNNHSDMFDFVFNNLQYASIEDLKKLCKLRQEHFLIKGKGRKSRNKKIFKYDLEHNLLNTYVNRNACMDAEQISKQALYNVLSGKRKTLNGFIYEEEQ